MIHHGDALQELLKRMGLTKSGLAKRLSVHPNTITNYVQSAELKLDTWRLIGKAIKKDPAEVVPGLPSFRTEESATDAAEPAQNYAIVTGTVPDTLSSCQKELLKVQAAYINLMQEHLALVRQVGAPLPPTN